MNENNNEIMTEATETVATAVAEASEGKSGVGKLIAIGVGLVCLAGGFVIGKVTGKGKSKKTTKKGKKRAKARRDDDDEVIDVDDYEECDDDEEEKPKKKAKSKKKEETEDEE